MKLMTDEEVTARCQEMGASAELEAYIRAQFEMMREWLADEDCGFVESHVARSDGRLGLFKTHADVLYDVAGIMGYRDVDAECPDAKKVFDRFFAE